MSTKKNLAALDKYHSGCDALASGFLEEAIQSLSDAISYDPNNAVFYVRRSQAHSMRRGVAVTDERQHYTDEETMAESLSFETTTITTAGINNPLGAFEAIQDANKALKLDPTNPECYVRRGECCLVHEGDVAGCIRVLKTAKERNTRSKTSGSFSAGSGSGKKDVASPATPISPPYVPMLLLEAEVAVIQRDFRRVTDICQQVLTLNATSDESIKASKYLYISHRVMNNTNNVTDKSPSGDATGNAAANLDNHDASDFISCLIASGQECFTSGGNIQQAIHHWKNALLLSTAVDSSGLNKVLRTKLAAAYRAIGRADLSGEIVVGAAGGGSNSTAQMDKGNTQFAAKNYEAALTSFLRAAELDIEIGNQAGYAAAWNNIACVYFAMKQYSNALKYFGKQKELAAEEHDIVRLVGSLSDMAECHLHLDEHQSAHNNLSECLNLQEDLYSITVLESDNTATGGGGDTSSNRINVTLVESYLSAMQRVYGIVIQLYLKIGKPIVALEWMERAKSLSFFQDTLCTKTSAVEMDVDVEDLQTKANASGAAILSFFVGGSGPGVVDGVLLTPDGTATHRAVSMEVLRLINPGCLVSEQKTMLEDYEAQLDEDGELRPSTEGGSVQISPSDPAIRRFRFQYQGLISPFQDILFGSSSSFKTLVIIPHGPLFGVAWNSLMLNQAALKMLDLTSATTTAEITLGGRCAIAVACTAASWYHCSSAYTAKTLTATPVSLINDPSLPLDPGTTEAVAISLGKILEGSGSTVQTIVKTAEDKDLSAVFRRVSQESKVVHIRARVCLKKLLSKPGTTSIKILGVPSVMPKSNRRERDASTNCVATEELVLAGAQLTSGTLVGNSGIVGGGIVPTTKTSTGWLFVANGTPAPYFPTARVSEIVPECAISLTSSYPALSASWRCVGTKSKDPLTSFSFPQGSVIVLDLHGSEVDAAAAKVDHIRALRAAGAALVVAPVNIAVEHQVRQEYLNYFYSYLLNDEYAQEKMLEDNISLIDHVGAALHIANKKFIDQTVANQQSVTALTDWAGYSVFV